MKPAGPSREEFIVAHEHEFFGFVFDALTDGRKGAEASIYARMIAAKIRARIGQMYDQLIPPEKIAPAAKPDGTSPPGPPAGQRPAQPRR